MKPLFGEQVTPPAIESSNADYSHILRECADIADERGKFYGTSKDNFDDISTICKVMFNLELTPEQIAQCFIATKVSRNKHRHKKDNQIDHINYMAILSNFQEQNSND